MATVGFAYLGAGIASGAGASAAAITAAQVAGAVVGSILDSAILALLAGPQKGPRLDGLRSGGYDEGNDAVRVIGRARAAGQVIWKSPLREVKKTTSTGLLGTTKLVNYDYFLDVAVAFSRQPSEVEEPVEKFWAQGVLFFDGDANETKTSGLITISPAQGKQKFFIGVTIVTNYIVFVHEDPTKAVYNFFEDFVVTDNSPVTVSGSAHAENNGTFKVHSVVLDYDGVPGRSRLTLIRCKYNLINPPCPSAVAEAPGGLITFFQQKPELNSKSLESVTQYNGAADQMPDPTIEIFEGEGNVPAHRGTGYILIKNLNVSRWGGAIPQIDALWKQRETTTVQQAILDVIRQVQRIDVDKQIDVSQVTGNFTGMLIPPSMSPTEALLQIMLVHDVDVQLTTVASADGERINGLRFFDRDISQEVDIADEDRGLGDFDSDDFSVIKTERSDPDTKPLMVSVAFQDHERDYQPGLRSYRRNPNAANATETVNLNIALAPADADALAKKVAWYLYANERSALSLRLPPSYLAVQEGDRVNVSGLDSISKKIRVGQVDRGANYAIELSGYEEYPQVYAQTGISGSSNYKSFITSAASIDFVVMDIPAVTGDAIDRTVLLGAASTTTPGVSFPGAVFYVSSDGGASYYEDVTTALGSGIGRVLSGAGGGTTGRFYDRKNEIVVEMYADVPVLFSTSESVAALGTSNWIHISNEIIGFVNAELIAPRTYRLTKLIRGRRNTEAYIDDHEADDIAVVVSSPSVVAIDLGLSGHNQIRTINASPPAIELDSEAQLTLTATSRSRRPFGPALRQAYRDAGGNVQINWRRRTRSFFRLLGGTAAPLDEPAEQYVLRILDGPGGAVLRTVNVSGTTTYLYTSGMQAVDFGGLESTIDIEIWQVSATIGAGNVTTGVV